MNKWICIHEDRTIGLTLNKIYDGIIIDEDSKGNEGLEIINDNGVISNYFLYRFKSLVEWREQQIKSIIDD
jgi:hypothetical protein